MAVNAGTSGQLFFAPISANLLGNTTIVTGTAGKTIVVVNYMMMAAASVTVQWRDSQPTNLSGAMPMVAGTMLACWGSLDSLLFACGQGNDLVLNASLAIGLSGHIAYILV